MGSAYTQKYIIDTTLQVNDAMKQAEKLGKAINGALVSNKTKESLNSQFRTMEEAFKKYKALQGQSLSKSQRAELADAESVIVNGISNISKKIKTIMAGVADGSLKDFDRDLLETISNIDKILGKDQEHIRKVRELQKERDKAYDKKQTLDAQKQEMSGKKVVDSSVIKKMNAEKKAMEDHLADLEAIQARIDQMGENDTYIPEYILTPKTHKISQSKQAKLHNDEEAARAGKTKDELSNEVKAQIDATTNSIDNMNKELENSVPQQQFDKISAAAEQATTKVDALDKEISELNVDSVSDEQFAQWKQMLSTLTGGDFSKVEKTPETIKQIGAALQKVRDDRIDEAKKSLDEMGDAAENTDKAVEDLDKQFHSELFSIDATQEATREIENLKSSILSVVGLSAGFGTLKRAINDAFETTKELDKTMTETAVVTDFSVSDMWSQLPEYTKRANELGVTINDAYEATTLFYQQGLNSQQAAEVSTETLKMARIAGLEAVDATNLMTAALRGFNMEINETSAEHINDVYSKLAAITAADTNEIATAMTKTASIASSAGMEFETTAAFLSQIVETTREAPETAGTALKTVIARFSEVKKLAGEGKNEGTDSEGEEIVVNHIQEALGTVGISMENFFNGSEGLDSIFLKLAEKWDTLDEKTQKYIATTAAGSRQQSRFLAMMSNYDRTMELVNAANNSAGASQEQFGKTTESLESKLNQLKNAWDEFVLGILNSDVLKGLIDVGTKLLQGLNKITGLFGNSVATSLIRVGAVITAFAGAKSLLMHSLNGLTKSLKGAGGESQTLTKSLTVLIAKMLGLKGVTEELDASGAIANKSFKDLGKSIVTFIKSPLGIAALATTAVIAGHEIYKTFFSAEGQVKRSQDAVKKLNEEISDIDGQLASNKTEYDQLMSKEGDLSTHEQNRLNILKNQTAELEKQKGLKQKELANNNLAAFSYTTKEKKSVSTQGKNRGSNVSVDKNVLTSGITAVRNLYKDFQKYNEELEKGVINNADYVESVEKMLDPLMGVFEAQMQLKAAGVELTEEQEEANAVYAEMAYQAYQAGGSTELLTEDVLRYQVVSEMSKNSTGELSAGLQSAILQMLGMKAGTEEATQALAAFQIGALSLSSKDLWEVLRSNGTNSIVAIAKTAGMAGEQLAELANLLSQYAGAMAMFHMARTEQAKASAEGRAANLYKRMQNLFSEVQYSAPEIPTYYSPSTTNKNKGKQEKEKKDWENPYDETYNIIQSIEEEQRKLNQLQEEYNRLVENGASKQEINENVKQQIASLLEQKKLQQELYDKSQAEIQKLMDDNPHPHNHAYYDKTTNQIYIKDSINDIKDEEYGKTVEAYIEKLEELKEQSDEAKEALWDIEGLLDEKNDIGKDEWMELERKTMDALIAYKQGNIDKLELIYNAIYDSTAQLLDGVRSNLEKERRDRENKKAFEDISDNERKLAYLQQDTSSGNILDVLSLGKQLEEQKQSYTDNLIDQKIDELERQNDEAAEQRNQQIDLLRAQVEYSRANGEYWNEVYDILEKGIDSTGKVIEGSRLDILNKQASDYGSLSALEQKNHKDMMDSLASLGSSWHDRQEAIESGKPDPLYPTEEEKPKDPPKPKPAPEKPKNSRSQQELVNVVYAVAGGQYGNGQARFNKLAKEGYSAKERQYIQDKVNEAIAKFGWSFGKSDLKKIIPSSVTFKKGGLANFTGPAWLDGTPSHPEIILNAKDSENFIKLKDILADKFKTNKSFGKSGDNYYEIHIEVDELANDYDVDKVANKIKKIIAEDSLYRNVNSINMIR